MNFLARILESLRYPSVKISWSWLASFSHSASVWRTDGQTDRQTDIPIVASTGLAATLTPCKNRRSNSQVVCLSLPSNLRMKYRRRLKHSYCPFEVKRSRKILCLTHVTSDPICRCKRSLETAVRIVYCVSDQGHIYVRCALLLHHINEPLFFHDFYSFIRLFRICAV